MTLSEVLSGVGLKQPLTPTLAAQEARGLDYDSRRIAPGYLFFAFPGSSRRWTYVCSQRAGTRRHRSG